MSVTDGVVAPEGCRQEAPNRNVIRNLHAAKQYGTLNASGRATFPLDLDELLSRTTISIALVCFATVYLASAEETPIVWTASSIGPAYSQSQALPCSAAPTACPVFSITAAGGLTAEDDIYAFTHRPLRGDGYLVARVSETNGLASALAGLSIRGSLDPGAAQLSLLQTAAGTLVVRTRPQANAPVDEASLAAVSGAPWLRLERNGQTISLAQSADGTQWASISGATIDLPEIAYAGLAVTSQRPNETATAVLSNVRLVSISSLPDGWTKVDLDASVSSSVKWTDTSWSITQYPGSPTTTGVTLVSQRVSGDAEISLRLRGLASPSAVAGPLVRSTLEPDSPYLWLRTSADGSRTVRRRAAPGLTPITTKAGSGPFDSWFRLVRQGAQVSAYSSNDGSSWTLLSTDVVDLTESVYLGVGLEGGAGLSATAVVDSLRVVASSANELPTISLTAPTSKQTLNEGELLALGAVASDNDDRVEVVEFFVDGGQVGADTAAPYASNWIAAGVGNHVVTALARDSDGAVVRTDPISVSVLARVSDGEDPGSATPTTPSSPVGGTDTSAPSESTDGTSGSWRLMFVPSADHDRTVDRYTAQIFALNGLALVSARDLGRPPVVDGECTVDLTTSIAALPAGPYQIVVRAVDDANDTQSDGATVDFLR